MEPYHRDGNERQIQRTRARAIAGDEYLLVCLGALPS